MPGAPEHAALELHLELDVDAPVAAWQTVSVPGPRPNEAVHPSLRYDAASGHLIVRNGSEEITVRHDGTAAWVGRIEDVGAVTASTLQRVLRRADGDDPGSDTIEVVENQEPGFDEDYIGSDIDFAVAEK